MQWQVVSVVIPENPSTVFPPPSSLFFYLHLSLSLSLSFLCSLLHYVFLAFVFLWVLLLQTKAKFWLKKVSGYRPYYHWRNRCYRKYHHIFLVASKFESTIRIRYFWATFPSSLSLCFCVFPAWIISFTWVLLLL